MGPPKKLSGVGIVNSPYFQPCSLKLTVNIRCAAPATDPGDQTRCGRHKQVSPGHCHRLSSCLACGHLCCCWPIWLIVINGLIITIMEFPQGRKLANIVVTQASIRLKFIFKILSITEVFNLVSKFEIKLLKWKLVQIWLHLSFQVLPREKLSDNFLAMHHPKMLPGCDFLPMFIWQKPNLDIEAFNGLSNYETLD